jgi:glycosyltransferase involved in cell wall biosynthesis
MFEVGRQVLTAEMPTHYAGMVVIIPTRNRAALAISAIRSVLAQQVSGVVVLLSNNSTDPQEVSALECASKQFGDDRLRQIKPPRSLSMTAHWDWALREALETYTVNHFVFLSDRMIFRANEINRLAAIVKLYPHKLLSYHHDRVVDYRRPVRLQQYPWTDKLLEVKTSHLSYLYSQCQLHPSLPRMLNCVVPRNVLEQMNERFGTIFSSISPDYNFGCRCLDTVDSFIYYDKSPLLSYALHRSNGANATRGLMSEDRMDFEQTFGRTPAFFAAPVPEIRTPGNAIIHEYCVVRQETQSPRFFDVNQTKYREYLLREIEENEDPDQRETMRALLAVANQDEVRTPFRLSRSLTSSCWRSFGALRVGREGVPELKLVLKLLSFLWRRILSGLTYASRTAVAKPAWLFLAHHFGVPPPGDNRFEFATAEEAIAYAEAYPRKKWKGWEWQERLLECSELPAPTAAKQA